MSSEEDQTMSLRNDINGELKTAKKIRLPGWGIVCLIVGSLPVYWLFDKLGMPNLALPALNSAGVLGLGIILKWRLRSCAWFWFTMFTLVALHVLLILLVPWGSRWVPFSTIAVFDSVDLIGILVTVRVVEKLMVCPDDAAR